MSGRWLETALRSGRWPPMWPHGNVIREKRRESESVPAQITSTVRPDLHRTRIRRRADWQFQRCQHRRRSARHGRAVMARPSATALTVHAPTCPSSCTRLTAASGYGGTLTSRTDKRCREQTRHGATRRAWCCGLQPRVVMSTPLISSPTGHPPPSAPVIPTKGARMQQVSISRHLRQCCMLPMALAVIATADFAVYRLNGQP